MVQATEALIENIMLQVTVEKNQSFHDAGGVTLGKLLDLLMMVPGGLPIKLQWGDEHLVNVGDIDSYRGYYSDLAIEPGYPEEREVADVYDMLNAAIGSTFEGYKGGDFVMHADTPVWVSLYGNTSGIGVTGVVATNRLAVITTARIEQY